MYDLADAAFQHQLALNKGGNNAQPLKLCFLRLSWHAM
jgi:hypothetical protein